MKNCSYCKKSLPDDYDSWKVIHDKCFQKYKAIEKTPESYIFMTGKHAGKTYKTVKEKHPKYIEWVKATDFKEDSALSFTQMYCLKFEEKQKFKDIQKNLNKKREKPELSEYGSSDEDELLTVEQ